MNWTKTLIGTLIGTIAYFLLGWLLYGIVLKDTFAMPEEFASVAYPEEEFNIVFMFLSCLVWAFLLTYIFQKWAGISTFMSGLQAGALLGALISLCIGLGMAAQFRFASLQTTGMDMVANAICSGLTGGVIAWYLGRK